tara:strand:+ start:1305 stop:2219 length:915 start_codon:yes stop_codon:yes gene_type:complete
MFIKSFMYHDIRNHKETDFGKIFHRRYNLRNHNFTKDTFIKQIDFIKNTSDIISASEFLELDKNDKGNYSILTFDDGLLDHYDILEILVNKQVTGTFFLPCEAITKRKVLLSHKIQFILSLVSEKKLSSYIMDKLNDHTLWNIYSVSKWKDNWWTPEMVFVTNVLRDHHRGKELAVELFNTYVTSDEEDFCDNFYLNINHVNELVNNGMHLGGHGYVSEKLSNMNEQEIEKELSESCTFIDRFYDECHIFAYPNGGYNDNVLRSMEKYEYDLAFTTEQKTLDTSSFDKLRIPRYDASQTRLLPQ